MSKNNESYSNAYQYFAELVKDTDGESEEVEELGKSVEAKISPSVPAVESEEVVEMAEPNFKIKFNLLEKNVEFLLQLGHHQDKILKKTTSELNRLSNIVARLNGNRRDRSGDDTSKDSVLEKSKIYVGNVPHSYTSNQVKSYFEKFGEVTESFYVRCHENTNVGFVTFSDEKIMEAVLAARPHFIGNRKIIVERARKREAGKENLSQSTSTDGFKAGKMTTRTGRYSPY